MRTDGGPPGYEAVPREAAMARPFPRLAGEIHCGGVPITELAERYGTPLYVYDLELVEERYKAFARAFEEVNPLVAYSVKANGSLAILHRLGSLGSGADIVSLGELYRARRAGIPAEKIVFAGVAKTAEEMRAAIQEGIYAFNVEGRGELERLDAVASEMGSKAPFAIRVNPDILSPTPHEYTRTGHAESKFGVPVDEAYDLYRWAQNRPHLKACGIDVHIGSQILDPMPYFRALSTVVDMAADLQARGLELRFVDIGGGFGVRYDDEPGMVIADLARALLPLLSSTGLRLVAEPGRFIVGEAGALVTRVQYIKRAGHKTFVIVDGGMTELIRPSHYGGFHAIEPVLEADGGDEVLVDVVGPICESGDFLARDRPLPIPKPGDLLVVKTAGAYGFAMASNYNARRRPAEAMVDRGDVYLVRRRETVEDLVRGEVIPWEGS